MIIADLHAFRAFFRGLRYRWTDGGLKPTAIRIRCADSFYLRGSITPGSWTTLDCIEGRAFHGVSSFATAAETDTVIARIRPAPPRKTE
jgi:hypothetical protein